MKKRPILPCNTQLNKEYDFLVHFELSKAIRNKDAPLYDIIDALKSATNEEQIREIIVDGINFQFQQTNNFQMISNTHQQLNSNHYPKQKNNKISPSTSTNAPKQLRTNSSTNVFQIQSLICSIFGYLDFKSLLTCSRVNKQWMYDSYHPSSLSHINTNQLYKICRSQNGTSSIVTYKSFYNINRFKKVESIKVDAWCDQLDEYFGNLKKFLNISKFIFDFGGSMSTRSKHCTTIMNKMIKNNKETLTSIIIRSRGQGKSQVLRSVFLPRLELLRLSEVAVNGLFLKGSGSVLDFDSSDEPSNKLKNVQIGRSDLNIGFWNDITHDNSDLSSITDLTLDECQINVKNDKIIESKYIPVLARKFKNLTYLKCTRLFTNTSRTTRSGAQSVTILPVFLHYLSQNEKIRKSLKSLHICVTPDWFTNTINNKIGDKYAFNFPNLKDVSISFRFWSRQTYTRTFENLNELRMMETILSLFCTRKCVRVCKGINKQKQNTYVSIHIFTVCILCDIYLFTDL